MSFAELILILHVLGASIVIASAFYSVVLTIKQPISPEKLGHLRFIGRFGMGASIWQFFTGLYLAAHEWSEFKTSKLFWIKMALYVLEGILASTLIGRKMKQAASGQSKSLTVTMLTWAVMIVLIAAIGVLLVEDHR
ncbi:MAG: hypothetical protein HY092_01540 [Candidatus Kerfeldbacteria bacterium]|nr:hypothetical protein [Candidatus Kerfeldbacteria bacterium]